MLDAPSAYEQASGQTDSLVTPLTARTANLRVVAAGPGSYLVTESVNEAWLVGKRYPIVLDPTIHDSEETTQPDCQIYSGTPYAGQNWCPNNGTDYFHVWSGYGDQNGQRFVGRGLLRPDISVLSQPGKALQSASFVFDLTSTTGNNAHDVCPAGNFWGNGPNTTWNNTAGGAPISSYCSTFWGNQGSINVVDVTAAVRAANTSAFPYYGFVFKDNNEDCCTQQSNSDAGLSPTPAAHAYFVLNYTQPPDQPSPASIAAANSAGASSAVRVQWNYPGTQAGSTGDGGLSVDYYYYVALYSCDGAFLSAVTPAASAGYGYTFSGQDPSQCYQGLVYAHNPNGCSTNYAYAGRAAGYPQAPALSLVSDNGSVSGTISYPAAGGPCQSCAHDGGAPLDTYTVRFYAANVTVQQVLGSGCQGCPSAS